MLLENPPKPPKPPKLNKNPKTKTPKTPKTKKRAHKNKKVRRRSLRREIALKRVGWEEMGNAEKIPGGAGNPES